MPSIRVDNFNKHEKSLLYTVNDSGVHSVCGYSHLYVTYIYGCVVLHTGTFVHDNKNVRQREKLSITSLISYKRLSESSLTDLVPFNGIHIEADTQSRCLWQGDCAVRDVHTTAR